MRVLVVGDKRGEREIFLFSFTSENAFSFSPPSFVTIRHIISIASLQNPIARSDASRSERSSRMTAPGTPAATSSSLEKIPVATPTGSAPAAGSVAAGAVWLPSTRRLSFIRISY